MNAHNSFTARSKHWRWKKTVIWTISGRAEARWVSVSCTNPGTSMAGFRGLEGCSQEPEAPALNEKCPWRLQTGHRKVWQELALAGEKKISQKMWPRGGRQGRWRKGGWGGSWLRSRKDMKPHEMFQNAGFLVTESSKERGSWKAHGWAVAEPLEGFKEWSNKSFKILSSGMLVVLLAVTRSAQCPDSKEEAPLRSQTHRHIWIKCTGHDSCLRPASHAGRPLPPLAA